MITPEMTIEECRRRGQVDGEDSARVALRSLAASDGGFRPAVERALSELAARAAEMAGCGVPADAIAAYRSSWSEAFERRLDRLAEQLRPLLPAEAEDDDT